MCPKFGEEEQTPDHIVFRCRKVRRVRDQRRRREWASGNGMRWDSWDALASKKWVRMEDSGRVDDEGRPILERVDLMDAFFTVRSKNHVCRRVRFFGGGWVAHVPFLFSFLGLVFGLKGSAHGLAIGIS